eukprot:4367885-Pleurochrysis_carterae.AAC.1
MGVSSLVCERARFRRTDSRARVRVDKRFHAPVESIGRRAPSLRTELGLRHTGRESERGAPVRAKCCSAKEAGKRRSSEARKRQEGPGPLRA